MKRADKEKVDKILSTCLNVIQSWTKISNTIQDIVNQMDGLRKCQWEKFELPIISKDYLMEFLEVRLLDEVDKLKHKLKDLKTLKNEFEGLLNCHQSNCSSLLFDQCSSSNTQTPNVSSNDVDVLNIMCSLFSSIESFVGISSFFLRRIDIQNSESLLLKVFDTKVFEADVQRWNIIWSES